MGAGQMTISEITLDHYLPEKRARRRANTVDGYESSLRRLVLPRWGGMRVGEVGRGEVQEWVDSLVPEHGPGGAWKAYKCLRQVVRWAMRRWGIFVADPTLGVERPRTPAYRPDVLSERRLRRLVRGMVGCECEASVVVSAALGTRPGETWCLRWEQIDWRSGRVGVRATLQRASDGLKEHPAKTARGERDCWLPAWALGRLRGIWEGLGRPKGRLIGDLAPWQAWARIRRRMRERRLPRITMRGLRHTWGTIAAQSGVPMATVAAMMGHSSVETTYRYYYALTASAAKSAQRRVAGRVLGGGRGGMYRGVDLSAPPRPPA